MSSTTTAMRTAALLFMSDTLRRKTQSVQITVDNRFSMTVPVTIKHEKGRSHLGFKAFAVIESLRMDDIRTRLVNIALEWQECFGVAPSITSAIAEVDAACLLVGMEIGRASCR